MTTCRDTDTVLLGDNSNSARTAPVYEDPAPDATPSDPGRPKPSDTPTTPVPDPSGTGSGEPGNPPGNRPDPDGGLADTGSGVPVGLLSGIAAAVVTAGGALVWWMRRRRGAHS